MEEWQKPLGFIPGGVSPASRISMCYVSSRNGISRDQAWPEFFHNMEIALLLGARMAEKIGMPHTPTSQDSSKLIQQALMEMQQEGFCGIWWFLSSWALKSTE
jgi:hypothetical protein